MHEALENHGSVLRKLVLGIAALVGLALGISLARIWAWNPSRLSREAQRELGRTLGCRFEAQKVEVLAFPRPQVVWSRCRLVWDRGTTAQVRELRLWPALAAMVAGEVVLGSVELSGVELQAGKAGDLMGTMSRVAEGRGRGFPDMSLRDASVLVAGASGREVVLRSLRGSLVRGLRSARISLGFDLELPQSGSALHGVALEGSLQKGSLVVRRLSLGELGVGAVVVWLSPTVEAGTWGFRLQGEGLYLNALRPLAMGLAPDLLQVKELFHRVKGGRLNHLRLEVQGRTRDGALEFLQARMRGELEAGEMLLPEPLGSLRSASGSMLVSHGFLELSSLAGSMDGGRIRGGSLRMHLVDPMAPLHLEAELEADLQNIPTLLESWPQGAALRGQMRDLYRVRGEASGRILVDGSRDSPRLGLRLGELRLFARHREIPYAVEIQGGTLELSPEGIILDRLRGTVGSSSFSELSGILDPQGEGWMDLRLGEGTLELEEVWSWLGDRLQRLVPSWELESVEGRLLIQEGRISGPLRAVENWEGNLTAKLEAQAWCGPLGGILRISGAQMEFKRDLASIKEAKLELPGGDLHLEGELAGWLPEVKNTKLELRGTLGRSALALVWDVVSQATRTKWRIPEELEANPMRLAIGEDRLEISGKMLLDRVLELHLDLVREGGDIQVKQLRFRAPSSHASMWLALGEKGGRLSFEGDLLGGTLELLVGENPLGQGRIQGNFRASWSGTGAGALELEAELLARDIPLWSLGMGQLSLLEGSLKGRGGVLEAENVRLEWNGREIHLEAKGQLSQEGLEWEGIMESATLDWQTILEMAERLANLPELARKGTLGIRLGELALAGVSASPFHADLELEAGGARLRVRQTSACNAGFSGTVDLSGGGEWVLYPIARGASLVGLLSCLGLHPETVEGRVDFQGELRGRELAPGFLESLRGNIEAVLLQGSFRGGLVLERLFKQLEHRRDLGYWLGSIGSKGISFSRVILQGSLREGLLDIHDGRLQGPDALAVGQGKVDLVTGELDVQVLAAVRQGGRKGSGQEAEVLLGIKIVGDLLDPKVWEVGPQGVSSSLMSRIRTLHLKEKSVLEKSRSGKADLKK